MATLMTKVDAKIAIVGAGIAGLTAASRLHSQGFQDVMILEAKDRIGGRMYTLPFGNSYIEIGAQWIHGEKGNPIHEIALKHDLIDKFAVDYMDSFYSWHPGLTEKENAAMFEVFEFLFDAEDEIEKWVKKNKPKHTSLNLKLFYHEQFQKHVEQCKDTVDIQKLKLACFDWFERLQNELNGSNFLKDVSATLFNSYKECDGKHTVELKYGYSSVLDVLMQSIPSKWILKNHSVNQINYKLSPDHPTNHDSKSTNPIKITCENGKVYLVDHVIITIPLGCLKAYSTSMFHPPLPVKKIKAIECLGFGVVGKIFLQFDEPFWKSQENYKALWLDGLDHEGNKYFSDLMCEDACNTTNENINNIWYRYINRFAYVAHQPNMLCCWITGKGASYMERLPDIDIAIGCHKALAKILQVPDLPFPKQVVRSTWASNPHSKGSYTYISIGCEKNNVLPKDLAEPIVIPLETNEKEYPLLLFGGEATHPHFYSTVHGAYSSGIREADRIINYYSERLQGEPINFTSPNQLCKQVLLQNPRNEFSNFNFLVPFLNLKTVIIGAGAAGLACAQRLSINGQKNISILEAQNYAGGRIHTVNFGESVLELGAQWVHGEEKNPLFEYANQRGLLADPSVDYSVEGKGNFCTDSGEMLPEKLVDDVIMVLDGIKEDITNYGQESLPEAMDPVGDLFRRGFEVYLNTCKDSSELKTIKNKIFDWYMRFEIIDNACYNLNEISSRGYSDWYDCKGVFHINFKQGFKYFIESLLSDIPEGCLKLNRPVKHIYWRKSLSVRKMLGRTNGNKLRSNSPVIIECEDGELISASHVVVTASLGYLKANCDSFFTPPLPSKKKTAIDHLGYGTINKIFLVFKEPFWKEDDLGFQLIWKNIEDSFQFETSNEWIKGISGFDTVRRQPNVLVGWVGGQEAKHMECISDEDLGRTCVHLIRKFLNRSDIPYPVQVIRSQWYSNPFICGSYSYHTIEFEKIGGKLSDFVEPLFCKITLGNGKIIQWPAVFFAGEATDPEYFSAVHGALRSGWREADNLMSFLKNVQLEDEVTSISAHPKL